MPTSMEWKKLTKKYDLGHRMKARVADNLRIKSCLNPIKFLKKVSTCFSSINYLYEGLKCYEQLSTDDIQKLQQLNLFIAYLEAACLDGLENILRISKLQQWPDVVQIYLWLFKEWDSSYLELNDFTTCKLKYLDRSFRYNPRIRCINEDLESEQSLQVIVDELRRLKRQLVSQDIVIQLKASTKLVEKNSQSARQYLKHSFKHNSVVLRFKIDNSKSALELNELKKLFTQFIKSIGRVPKRIGAEIEAYIGYYVLDGKSYSIDCTVILSIRSGVFAQNVKEGFEDHWQSFFNKYVKTEECDFSQLNLLLIPTLWVKDESFEPFVVNKRDKIITQLKKDLVRFYTAYEYIHGYRVTKKYGVKRPELFLRGRNRKPISKDKKTKESQQSESTIQSVEENSFVDEKVLKLDNTIQQEEDINELQKRAQELAAKIKPLGCL